MLQPHDVGAALAIHVRVIDGEACATRENSSLHLRHRDVRLLARVGVEIELVEHRQLRRREADRNERLGGIADLVEAGGMMPITSYDSPFMRIVRPTIARSPLKRRCQRRWLSTTTLVRPG